MVSEIAKKRGLLTLRDLAERIGIAYQVCRYAVLTSGAIPPPTVQVGKRKFYTEVDVKTIKALIAGK